MYGGVAGVGGLTTAPNADHVGLSDKYFLGTTLREAFPWEIARRYLRVIAIGSSGRSS
jgi:hypothetical protein